MSQALVKLTINNAIQGPHLMSLAGWADLFTKTNFALVPYEKFQPSFRDDKRPKILGCVLAENSRNKAYQLKHKNFNFHDFDNS